MNTAARIVPSYRSIVRLFEKPMKHGGGRRFLTNPAIYGRDEQGELFGNVVCARGSYYVAGPGFTGREKDLQTAALAGDVGPFNCQQTAPAQQVYRCGSPAEALAQLWALVVEHYGITDADEQLAQFGRVAQLPAELEPEDEEDMLSAGDLETVLAKLLKS
jgi:hypothetical protein